MPRTEFSRKARGLGKALAAELMDTGLLHSRLGGSICRVAAKTIFLSGIHG
jgi:hypothetical protein